MSFLIDSYSHRESSFNNCVRAPPNNGLDNNMNEGLMYRDRLLSDLTDSIIDAANFFINVNENFFDGHQSAREVLSHLLFWHREYCAISLALLRGNEPTLLSGSLAVLNGQATCKYQKHTMAELAQCLVEEQKTLVLNLQQLEDWNINFPFKKGCRKIDVAGRICAITDHVRLHLLRQNRAFQRGEEWIKAYYSNPHSKLTH